MNSLVKVFVFVDALGWEQVEKYDFLRDLLPNRRRIEMQFGYSCTAIPTILSGKRPSEHGHLAFYDYAPAKSPFRMMRYLAPLLRPRSFWRRGRVRHQLSKLIKRLYGFTGSLKKIVEPYRIRQFSVDIETTVSRCQRPSSFPGIAVNREVFAFAIYEVIDNHLNQLSIRLLLDILIEYFHTIGLHHIIVGEQP